MVSGSVSTLSGRRGWLYYVRGRGEVVMVIAIGSVRGDVRLGLLLGGWRLRSGAKRGAQG